MSGDSAGSALWLWLGHARPLRKAAAFGCDRVRETTGGTLRVYQCESRRISHRPDVHGGRLRCGGLLRAAAVAAACHGRARRWHGVVRCGALFRRSGNERLRAYPGFLAVVYRGPDPCLGRGGRVRARHGGGGCLGAPRCGRLALGVVGYRNFSIRGRDQLDCKWALAAPDGPGGRDIAGPPSGKKRAGAKYPPTSKRFKPARWKFTQRWSPAWTVR